MCCGHGPFCSARYRDTPFLSKAWCKLKISSLLKILLTFQKDCRILRAEGRPSPAGIPFFLPALSPFLRERQEVCLNLTEVLLAVIVSLAVIAGGYTLYTNVSDKNEVAQVMQNVSLLRANIEDAYDGNYENLSSDASDGSLYDLGILPERLARVSASGTTPATKWGPITIEAGSDPSTYTISFSGLSKDICLHLGRFQYRSWAKVEAGGTAVWTRGTDTGLKTAELVQACKAGNVAVTFTAP